MLRLPACAVLMAFALVSSAQDKTKVATGAKRLEFLSAGLTMGPGIQPIDGKVDPAFPMFGGTVAWRGKGPLTARQIRLYLLTETTRGRTKSQRLPIKTWEPADPLNPEQWRFQSVWPGGPAEGRRVRVTVLDRGRVLDQVEGAIRVVSLPAAAPR